MDHDPIQQYDGETLADTRYGVHFEVTPRRGHFGLFGGCEAPSALDAGASGACC